MLLSVVIPAYNVEEFILAAVNSVLAQSCQDFEVIVVDDGSSDATGELVAGVQDPRVKLLRQKNAGLAAARNTGIRAAQGKYIGLLDGDDVWFPLKAQEQLLLMEQDPSLGITYTYSAYIDEGGKPTGQLWVTTLKTPTFQDLIRRNHIMASSAMICRDCFSRAGLFDENLRACEDQEMWVRILYNTSYRARLVPQVLTGYRVRAGSLMTNFAHQLENAHRVMKIFQANIPEFSPKLKNRALSETYRIVSRKALSAGNLEAADKIMAEALRYCPTIIFRDLRALATFFLVNLQRRLPQPYQQVPYHWTRLFMKRIYQCFRRISACHPS